jgi:hypothetical protein
LKRASGRRTRRESQTSSPLEPSSRSRSSCPCARATHVAPIRKRPPQRHTDAPVDAPALHTHSPRHANDTDTRQVKSPCPLDSATSTWTKTPRNGVGGRFRSALYPIPEKHWALKLRRVDSRRRATSGAFPVGGIVHGNIGRGRKEKFSGSLFTSDPATVRHVFQRTDSLIHFRVWALLGAHGHKRCGLYLEPTQIKDAPRAGRSAGPLSCHSERSEESLILFA